MIVKNECSSHIDLIELILRTLDFAVLYELKWHLMHFIAQRNLRGIECCQSKSLGESFHSV